MIDQKFLNAVQSAYFEALVSFALTGVDIDLVALEFAVVNGATYRGYPTVLVTAFIDYQYFKNGRQLYAETEVKINCFALEFEQSKWQIIDAICNQLETEKLGGKNILN